MVNNSATVVSLQLCPGHAKAKLPVESVQADGGTGLQGAALGLRDNTTTFSR
jgi:hypothetical protein